MPPRSSMPFLCSCEEGLGTLQDERVEPEVVSTHDSLVQGPQLVDVQGSQGLTAIQRKHRKPQ